jgi:hypothetical protein
VCTTIGCIVVCRALKVFHTSQIKLSSLDISLVFAHLAPGTWELGLSIVLSSVEVSGATAGSRARCAPSQSTETTEHRAHRASPPRPPLHQAPCETAQDQKRAGPGAVSSLAEIIFPSGPRSAPLTPHASPVTTPRSTQSARPESRVMCRTLETPNFLPFFCCSCSTLTTEQQKESVNNNKRTLRRVNNNKKTLGRKLEQSDARLGDRTHRSPDVRSGAQPLSHSALIQKTDAKCL